MAMVSQFIQHALSIDVEFGTQRLFLALTVYKPDCLSIRLSLIVTLRVDYTFTFTLASSANGQTILANSESHKKCGITEDIQVFGIFQVILNEINSSSESLVF